MAEPTQNPDGTTTGATNDPSSLDWQKYVDQFGKVYEQVGEVLKTFQNQPGATKSPETVDPKPAAAQAPKDDMSWLWLLLAAGGIYYLSR